MRALRLAVVDKVSGVAKATVDVDVARTPADRERGLTGTRWLPADRGMLFLFPKAAMWPFWMKGVPTSLGIAFLNEASEVIATRVMRANDATVVQPPVPVRSAVEVSVLFLRAHVRVGDLIRIVR